MIKMAVAAERRALNLMVHYPSKTRQVSGLAWQCGLNALLAFVQCRVRRAAAMLLLTMKKMPFFCPT
jgi:hypothetical protein